MIAQLLWKAQKIGCTAEEDYIYIYQRKGGIMSSRQVQGHFDWLEALYRRFFFCKDKPELFAFTSETRAVYFRALNDLFLLPDLHRAASKQQLQQAKKQYAQLDGKTKTERINWAVFQISPSLDHWMVQKVRSRRRT